MFELADSSVRVSSVFGWDVPAGGESVPFSGNGSHFSKVFFVVFAVDFLLVFEFADLFFLHFKHFLKDSIFVEFIFDGVNSHSESLIFFFESFLFVFVDVKGLVNLEEVVFLGLKFLAQLDDFVFFLVEFFFEF